MDTQEEVLALDERLQNVLTTLSKCKIKYINENEECNKLREINTRLEIELKEIRELEKSHRYHLVTSREMIGSLQETVSRLVYLKRDIKKVKEQLAHKEAILEEMEKDKENVLQKRTEDINKIKEAHEKQLDILKDENDKKIQQIQHECDAQIAQFSCAIEEMRVKMREMEADSRDKISVVVLEYEEKLQRETAKVANLEEQLSRETVRSDLNIAAYRRRLEELEEKCKQTRFQQHLQNNYSSRYESEVERPYSINREEITYREPSLDMHPIQDRENLSLPSQNKPLKPTSSLQVIYYDKKPEKNTRVETTEKSDKGLFHITKKRKLYNPKDFQDF